MQHSAFAHRERDAKLPPLKRSITRPKGTLMALTIGALVPLALGTHCASTCDSERPPQEPTVGGPTPRIQTGGGCVKELSFGDFPGGWTNTELLRHLFDAVETRRPLVFRGVGAPRGIESAEAVVEGAGLGENVMMLWAAGEGQLNKLHGDWDSKLRESVCTCKPHQYGTMELPVRGAATWWALNGSDFKSWGPSIDRELCKHFNKANRPQGSFATTPALPKEFSCTKKELRKVLGARSVQQLYLRETLKTSAEEYHPKFSPIMPYLHRMILASDATPPPRLEVKPGVVLDVESRQLRGGAPGAIVFAHMDCYSNILLNYWGSRDIQLFDTVSILASGGVEAQAAFEALWRLLNLRKDLSASGVPTIPLQVALREGDGIYIPELFLHDVEYVNASLGLNLFYESVHNMGQTLCKFIKGYGPQSCGGKVSAQVARRAAKMTVAANDSGSMHARNWNTSEASRVRGKTLDHTLLNEMLLG